MQQLKPILIKTAVVSFLMLGTMSILSDYTMGRTLLLAVALSAFTYYIGDFWLLSVANNTWTTAADFVLFTLFLWIIGPLIYGASVPFLMAIQVAMVLVIGEWLFHLYMLRNVLQRPEKTRW